MHQFIIIWKTFSLFFRASVPLELANAVIDWTEGLAEELGLSFHPKQTIRLTTSLEFLGLELDSNDMEALLLKGLPTILEMLESLQFCVQVVLYSCMSIHGLIDFE